MSGWDIGRDIAAVELDQGGAGELAALAMTCPVIRGAGRMPVNQSGGGGPVSA